MGAAVDHLSLDLAAEKGLAVAALNAQRQRIVEGVIDLFQQRRAGIEIMRHVHQKRSRSGKGSWPWCTCMAPNSAQRCRVGMFLPGLSRPLGSKAAFTAWNRVATRRPYSADSSAMPLSTPGNSRRGMVPSMQ